MVQSKLNINFSKNMTFLVPLLLVISCSMIMPTQQRELKQEQRSIAENIPVDAAAAKNDFRPISPGHSGGGVGHVETASLHGATDDWSPGVGHHVTTHEFRPTTNELVYEEAAKDDFRPTTPGHSPGAGHSTGPTSQASSYP